MASLDDVLSDKPTEKTTEAPAPEPKAESTEPRAEPGDGLAADGQPKKENRRREHQKKEWEAQGRDPTTGQFVAKQEKNEAPKPEAKPEAKHEPKPEPKPAEVKAEPAKPPQQEMSDKERAAFAAAADERKKRQELERRLAALEAAQQQKPKEEPKKFWDDPDAALKNHEQALRNVEVNTRLQTAELIARGKYTDYDETIAHFAELVKQYPGLGPQMVQQIDPAEFAYRTAKNHREMQQAGGLDKLRAEIDAKARAEERAKVEAEFKAKQEQMERERAAIPPSLSDVRGAAPGQRAAVWGGPTPLADVLTGKR
jgi:hypothetical protein